jgi:hypothetical protein
MTAKRVKQQGLTLFDVATRMVSVAMRYDGALDEQLGGFFLSDSEKIAARTYALTYRQYFLAWPAGIHRLPGTKLEVIFSAAE